MSPAAAHEYWLDPLDATLAPGQPMLVMVRNGEDYLGASYPFDPSRFSRVEMLGPDGRETVTGRPGDEPALRLASQGVGLHLLLLEAGLRTVTYADMQPFEAFLDYHGLRGVAERHVERGLPGDEVLESYTRHTKTFIKVSTPGKAHEVPPEALVPQGMDYELMLDADPYATGLTRVQALYQQQPLADVQVELFVRDGDGEVERRVARTDAQGQVDFDTSAAGDYLINSVHLIEAGDGPGAGAYDAAGAGRAAGAAGADGADSGAHWRSYWTTLTFERDTAVR